jgi:hypothetical protein
MKIRKFNDMTKEEFIKWLENNTSFERKYNYSDTDWKYMVDYADYIFDELEILDDKVIFSWEYRTFGDTEYKKDEYTFDEFIDKYNRDTLKY